MTPDLQSGSECHSVCLGMQLKLGPQGPCPTAVCHPEAACPRCRHPVLWVPLWEGAMSVQGACQTGTASSHCALPGGCFLPPCWRALG